MRSIPHFQNIFISLLGKTGSSRHIFKSYRLAEHGSCQFWASVSYFSHRYHCNDMTLENLWPSLRSLILPSVFISSPTDMPLSPGNLLFFSELKQQKVLGCCTVLEPRQENNSLGSEHSGEWKHHWVMEVLKDWDVSGFYFSFCP